MGNVGFKTCKRMEFQDKATTKLILSKIIHHFIIMINPNLNWWRRDRGMGEWSSFVSIVRNLCLLYVTHKYLCTTVITYGPSMLPTLNITGNLLLVERISTRTGKLRPGDVVIFRSPETPRKFVCKRLIGMEGDQVTYVVDPKYSDRCESIMVPKGHVWVEGDYIYNTKDSRNFGAVPYGLLEGRACWTLLPLKDFGSLAPKPK